jgi:hypothetical protein
MSEIKLDNIETWLDTIAGLVSRGIMFKATWYDGDYIITLTGGY